MSAALYCPLICFFCSPKYEIFLKILTKIVLLQNQNLGYVFLDNTITT